MTVVLMRRDYTAAPFEDREKEATDQPRRERK